MIFEQVQANIYAIFGEQCINIALSIDFLDVSRY